MWHRAMLMNCLSVSSCLHKLVGFVGWDGVQTSWFCRLGWRSAMNLDVVKGSCV